MSERSLIGCRLTARPTPTPSVRGPRKPAEPREQDKVSIAAKLGRVARSLGVGAVASVVDMAVLAVLVSGLHLPSQLANVPALVAGALVQFLGCRHLVFGASNGALRRQLAGFVATEAGTLALNGLAFHLLVTLTPVPYPLARLLGTFLVFVSFSFPLWTRVFGGRT